MKLLALLVFCFLLFSSCGGSSQCSGKQVTCPSFTDDLSLHWVPYKMNQQIIFTSATTRNDTFNIKDISLSDSYQGTISASQPFCTSSANFRSGENDITGDPKLGVTVGLNYNQFSNSQQKESYVRLKRSAFQGAGFSDTGIVRSNDYTISHFYNTATVSNKIFTNIQEVYLDTFKTAFKSTQVYKLWIARNIGIVGYEEYHGNLWVKQ